MATWHRRNYLDTTTLYIKDLRRIPHSANGAQLGTVPRGRVDSPCSRHNTSLDLALERNLEGDVLASVGGEVGAEHLLIGLLSHRAQVLQVGQGEV